jgi:hypothetical protein
MRQKSHKEEEQEAITSLKHNNMACIATPMTTTCLMEQIRRLSLEGVDEKPQQPCFSYFKENDQQQNSCSQEPANRVSQVRKEMTKLL